MVSTLRSVETKSPPFFSDDIFLQDNGCISIQISLKFVPRDLINKKRIIGSDNGLAPNRREAIISNSGGLVYRRTFASLDPDELEYVTSPGPRGDDS